MLKKRLVGVVTVRHGWAVQSFGYNRHLPIGRPECLVENLDRWGADEILVQAIDRSKGEMGPDFDMLARVGKLGLETPLIYAGGIATEEHATRAIQLGADRICVDYALHHATDEVRKMSARLGAQAIIGAVPINFSQGLRRLDYVTQQERPFGDVIPGLISQRVISELVLIDWKHDGGETHLTPEQLDPLPIPQVPLILFGGFSDPTTTRRFYQHPAVAAVAVGNLFTYREHAYQMYKREVESDLIRPAAYVGASTSKEF
ncbi:HisA/HisF-related TIM barrel protein [Denitromonas ohlonensis]|uniref:Imidazole glycerol phosphate synthase subunit HisF n=2 Tax=Denitromonas TaxID=139331 RepID=A0A557SED3_9RHOO|nr:HisA/HisF-related TIM barrel protein [Denitromonas ohlonensis]TVO60267.1 hypothetical protein FHP90_18820 [Denitromonas ohlonensis]TVO75754.1 hypothetical protein FHP89_12430 [Denitromonas ohlonensis]